METPILQLSIPEAAKAMSISVTTLYRLMNAGEIESALVGRRRLIPLAAIEDYIHGRQGYFVVFHR